MRRSKERKQAISILRKGALKLKKEQAERRKESQIKMDQWLALPESEWSEARKLRATGDRAEK